MTVRKVHIALIIAASLTLAVVVVPRSSADTSDRLKATRARLSDLNGQLNQLAAAYSAAETRALVIKSVSCCATWPR